MKIWAVIRNLEFRAIHHYPCGDKLSDKHAVTIQYEHTHRFYVDVKITQLHSNREIEYITFENEIRYLLGRLQVEASSNLTMSCEEMGLWLYNKLKLKGHYKDRDIIISVSEDNINGCELGDF